MSRIAKSADFAIIVAKLFAVTKRKRNRKAMDRTLKIAVCDDLPADRAAILRILSAYLDRNDLVARTDTFASGEEFLQADTAQYDLVFLDIFMPGRSGMETARALLEQNPRVQIVFASTSLEFAAEAFNIEALHYIVKPIAEEQLTAVLDKFFDGLYSLRTVTVKVGRLEESLYLADILYIEAKGKHTVIHLKGGHLLEASQSLAEMSQLLPAGDFCQPIRWALVSMREIVSMPSNSLKLSDQSEIPISRGKREEMRAAFADFRWATMRRRMRGRPV